MTQIAIISYPHSDNKDFADEVLRTHRFMTGENPNPQLDREALNSLKQQFNRGKPKV